MLKILLFIWLKVWSMVLHFFSYCKNEHVKITLNMMITSHSYGKLWFLVLDVDLYMDFISTMFGFFTVFKLNKFLKNLCTHGSYDWNILFRIWYIILGGRVYINKVLPFLPSSHCIFQVLDLRHVVKKELYNTLNFCHADKMSPISFCLHLDKK